MDSSPHGRLGQYPTMSALNPGRPLQSRSALAAAMAAIHLSYCSIAAGTSPSTRGS
jgi:hypothetical protein